MQNADLTRRPFSIAPLSLPLPCLLAIKVRLQITHQALKQPNAIGGIQFHGFCMDEFQIYRHGGLLCDGTRPLACHNA